MGKRKDPQISHYGGLEAPKTPGRRLFPKWEVEHQENLEKATS